MRMGKEGECGFHIKHIDRRHLCISLPTTLDLFVFFLFHGLCWDVGAGMLGGNVNAYERCIGGRGLTDGLAGWMGLGWIRIGMAFNFGGMGTLA